MISIISLPSPLGWIFGHAPSWKKILNRQSWCSLWFMIKTLDSMLRGIAQVCFADNPVSGLLILIGLFVSDVTAGVGAVLCSLAAIATALVFQQPDDAITSGLTNFSAVLVGTVTASLYPLFFHQPLVIAVWGYMLLAAIFSVCIGSGLGTMLSTFNLPCFTLPFNIATCIIFICMRAAGVVGVPAEAATSVEEVQDIQWSQVFLGTLLSAGQVYAVESVFGSCLIVAGLLVCSPLLTFVSLSGALVACLTALVVSSPPYSLLYSGVWGYNGFLSAGCLVFFVVPGPRLYALAFLNAIFTTFLQAGLTPLFGLSQLPVFTFPFCTSSLLFLAMASAGAVGSPRVTNPTFPENHMMSFLKSRKNGQGNDV